MANPIRAALIWMTSHINYTGPLFEGKTLECVYQDPLEDNHLDFINKYFGVHRHASNQHQGGTGARHSIDEFEVDGVSDLARQVADDVRPNIVNHVETRE